MNPIDMQINPIVDKFEIDERLLSLAALDKQIDEYKELKRKRVDAIDREIDRLEAVKTAQRDAILGYMSQNDEKTLNFPGVGKVTRKAGSGKWVVTDEEKVANFLKERLPSNEWMAVVIEEPKLVKKELNKVLNRLSQVGQVCDGVQYEQPQDVISISFDKEEGLTQKIKSMQEWIHDTPVVSVSEKTPDTEKAMDYDALEF